MSETRYNFKVTEGKWQKYWEIEKKFQTEIDNKKKKILLFRNVSISLWKNSHGTC